MSVPIWSAKFLNQPGLISRLQLVGSALEHRLTPLPQHLEKASLNQRRVLAVSVSFVLHLGLVLLLLPSKTGLSASMGTVTGLGRVNGAGTAVTLIDVLQLPPLKTSQIETVQKADKQNTETASTPPEEAEPVTEATNPDKSVTLTSKTEKASAAETPPSDGQILSDSLAEATAGAFGQSGQSNLDLWNAIAPCWNRIADGSTLPATLKVSFDANGALAVPPEIERDPDAQITNQSLKSEAQALQALSECGAYSMAHGQQGVVVQFPTPGQMPSNVSGNPTEIAAVRP